MKKVMILIPALDPPSCFLDYVQELMTSGFGDIIVVDDGSSSDECFEKIRALGCTVLKHPKNEGKGQALKTGLQYYKEHCDYGEYAGVITADSDGQHLCGDVKKLAEKLKTGSEVLLLGARDFSLPQVPPKSKFGNSLTAWIFRYLLRLKISDTQTGLRGIPNALIDICLHIPGQRFEYETSMLIEIGKQGSICEIPITTVYYDENEGTHFHPVADSFKIYRTIFGTFVRYLFSSLSASVIDIVLFTLLINVLSGADSENIFLATGIARVVSSIYNFCINRNLVFKSKTGYAGAALRYFGLCVIQGFASAVLVNGVFMAAGGLEVFWKITVDTLLFFASYQIQKRLIFKERRI